VRWYWSRVVPSDGRRPRGHRHDLPADDPAAGLPLCRPRRRGIGGGTDSAVVAMSLGGFTAPLSPPAFRSACWFVNA
jgi:hypothetical protein